MTDRAPTAILEARDLSVHFGGVAALDGIDFTLREKELRCLIGPNGAGKSTFFNCLTGTLHPTSGDIRIKGENVSGWDPHRITRLGVGIKTQTPSVMDGLSVFENIWLAARRTHSTYRANEIVKETMARLNLEKRARDIVGQLAHGERQRVELAMVITSDPWLVLLDEPAAGMTGKEIDGMITLIRDINKLAAIIVVEHDMQFIRRIAETVTVFHQGKILIEDNVDVVLNDSRVRDVYLGREKKPESGNS